MTDFKHRDERVFVRALKDELRRSDNGTAVYEQFWVSRSRADVLVAESGRLSIYEIKSDVDTLARLPSQLSNYYCGADVVNILTGERQLSAVMRLLSRLEFGSSVGVLVLQPDNRVRVVRAAEPRPDSLRHDVLFKMLRKSEYSDIVRMVYGRVPDVPPVFYFRECLRQFSGIPIADTYTMVADQLTGRLERVPGHKIGTREEGEQHI